MLGVDASGASAVFQTQTPFAVILVMIFFKNRSSWRWSFCAAVAFAGVVVLAGEPLTSTTPGSAILITAGTFMWVVGSMLVKCMVLVDPLAFNGWIALFLAPQIFAASIIFETGQVDAVINVGWGGVVSMVLGVTILGYGMWYWLLSCCEVNQVMPLNLITPVFGLFAGAIFVSEPVSQELVIGTGIVLLGVAILIFEGHARPSGITL